MLIYDFKSGKMEKFAMPGRLEMTFDRLRKDALRALKRIAFAATLDMFLARNRRRRKGSPLLRRHDL